MAYYQDNKKKDTVLHKSHMVIYSWLELQDWLRKTRRSDEAQAVLKRCEAHAAPSSSGPGRCPVCGSPKGQRGFVRAPAMPDEWAFAKLFACPKCWPFPLGKDPGGQLYQQNEREQEEAASVRIAAKGL